MASFEKEFEDMLMQPAKDLLKQAEQYKKEYFQRSLEFLKKRYSEMPYPLKINNEDVSKVHPIEIANSLQIVDLGNGNMDIRIVSSNPDVEWSAKRYAFLTQGNNPFAELRQRFDAGLNI